jgi:hypothetical protein
MPLGLGSNLSKTGLTTPGVVTDNLVLKHKYDAGSVVPVSDGAAYFDGINDYISTAHTTPTGNYTISAWINNIGTGSYYAIYSGGLEIWLGIHGSNGHVLLHGGDGSKYVRTADNLISTNRWYHITITWDGSNAKIYIDGVLCSTTASGVFENAASTSVDIGNRSDNNSNDFNGYICNVAAWTTALTQPQIKSIMNKNYAGLTSSETENLASWWNLDEGITTDGSVTFALDEHTTTLTTAPNQTWAVQSGSPTVNGQEITFTAGESQQVGCSLSTGAGNYKVNMTVSDYSGSGTISLLWDGGGSSDLRTTGNGTFEWITYLDSSPNILKDSGAAGKVTVNSIKKYDGNVGEFK